MRRIVFGYHKDAAGFLVESMNDSGTLASADPGKILAMREESVDEGVLGVTRAGMHNQACGFVEDEEVVIFKEDV